MLKTKNKILSLVAMTSILALSACNNANNKTILANFTGGVSAPNAYGTYKNTGLKVPDNNTEIPQPNIKNNYLLQLNEIQQKVVQAILLDQSKDIQEEIEPEKIVYLNSDNIDPTEKDDTLIKDNSTKEDDILFDDLTLFSNKSAKKTIHKKSAKAQLNANRFTTTASIRDDVNTNEITNKNFINNFKDYILYDETTKIYTADLLNLHITTNNGNRLKFFRLLDLESQPIDTKSKRYFLYHIGLLKTTPTEYILDAKAEKIRLQKLTATNKKITGDLAPMYKTGNANTTFIGGYLNKVGLKSATESEIRNRQHTKHSHQYRYTK